jgi:hypothetical protein
MINDNKKKLDKKKYFRKFKWNTFI